MRHLVLAALATGAITMTSPAGAAPARPHSSQGPAAVAAQRYGVEAAYRGPAVGHGYSPDARRRADCLATFPAYDWKTDRIRPARGSARPCPL